MVSLTVKTESWDDDLSMSLKFFRRPVEIGTDDRGLTFQVVIRAIMYLSIPGIQPHQAIMAVAFLKCYYSSFI